MHKFELVHQDRFNRHGQQQSGRHTHAVDTPVSRRPVGSAAAVRGLQSKTRSVGSKSDD